MGEIKHDKFGHCVVCGKKMIEEKVAIGDSGKPEVQIVFTKDYDEEALFMDNGTHMRIAICKKCKEEELDYDKIMETVVKGWEKEIESKGWTTEKIKEYFNNFGNLNIVCKFEDANLDENKLKYNSMREVRDKKLKKLNKER